MWEGDRGQDAAVAYEELLAKIKDYSRRIKLDHSVKKNMQHGGDPMDVGAVQGQWDEYYYDQEGGGEGDGEVDAVGYYGYKGKGKGKGKSKGKGKGGGSARDNSGSPGHFSRDCPYPQKGKGEKGKGKGFQGMCYTCGEVGHPARECPK